MSAGIGAGLAKFFVFIVQLLPDIIEAFYEKHPEFREQPPPPPAGESDADAVRSEIDYVFEDQ